MSPGSVNGPTKRETHLEQGLVTPDHFSEMDFALCCPIYLSWRSGSCMSLRGGSSFFKLRYCPWFWQEGSDGPFLIPARYLVVWQVYYRD